MERDYTNDLYYVADQIRGVREFYGWSQEELADRAEISLSTLYRIEAGKPCSLDVFLKILDVAEIPAERLLPTRTQGKNNFPKNYNKLNPKNKDVVLSTVSTLIDSLLLTQ